MSSHQAETVVPLWTDRLVATLSDPAWWAEQVIIWAIFSVLLAILVSFIVSRRTRQQEANARAPFEGWTLHVVGYADYDDPQKIDWQEVRRFRASEFELWKFAKSVVSGACTVTPLTAAPAVRHAWLRMDEGLRRIVVDFNNLPQEHVASFYPTAKEPDAWEWVIDRDVQPPTRKMLRKDRAA